LNASGVYIGKLEPKMKEIKDNDDDTAHIDEDASLVIKFHFANDDHKSLMLGKILKND
jgi:hypothetical protein